MADVTPIVFIVDDDISVRESLDLPIYHPGWQPRLFAAANEVLVTPRVLVPSCLILDFSLPGIDGLQLQERIAGDRIDMPIIFLTGYDDVPMTVKAMKAGAAEFLTKPLRDDVLLSAVRNAIERSQVILSEQAQVQQLRERSETLTAREREVMALVVSGFLNKQVAGELTISEITVKAHRGKAMRKMKARSLADLAKMTSRLGIGLTAKA